MNYSYTFRELVNTIIGTYTPITTGEGIGTVDFPYIFAGIILVMSVYMFFKFLYGIFKR